MENKPTPGGYTPGGPTPGGPTPGGRQNHFTPQTNEHWEDPEDLPMVEMPQVVDFKKPADFSAMKSSMKASITKMEQIMNKSIKDIDKVYQSFLHQMTDSFKKKHQEYEVIHQQLELNNKFLLAYAQEVQNVLEQHREAVIDEKDTSYTVLKSAQEAWRKEVQMVYEKNNFQSPILSIDAGGQLVKASKALLCSEPGSLLEKTFSGYHEHTIIDDKIFMDRDGTAFQHVVNFLRSQKTYAPRFEDPNEEDLFVRELQFWGIDAPSYSRYVEEKKLASKLDSRLVDHLHSKPDGLSELALRKWNQLGPVRFTDIAERSFARIDYTLQFGSSSSNHDCAGQIIADEYGMQEFVSGIGRVVYRSNGSLYEGQFKNESKHGWGRQIWNDGEYYEGQFKDDKRDGIGKFVRANGEVQVGAWVDDFFQA